MIITEADRQAAKQQPAKTKMSATQIARLAAIKEQDRVDRESSRILIEQFERSPKDAYTLSRILSRLSTDQANLERRALKLRWSLAHGWKPTDATGILFLAALTPDELKMSDEKFVRHLESTWPEQKPIRPQPKKEPPARLVRRSTIAKARVWESVRPSVCPPII